MLCNQLIRTTNLFQVDLFSAYVAPASRSIVPYLPEWRVQGRVNISDTFEQWAMLRDVSQSRSDWLPDWQGCDIFTPALATFNVTGNEAKRNGVRSLAKGAGVDSVAAFKAGSNQCSFRRTLLYILPVIIYIVIEISVWLSESMAINLGSSAFVYTTSLRE
jgi:hypothetical protein